MLRQRVEAHLNGQSYEIGKKLRVDFSDFCISSCPGILISWDCFNPHRPSAGATKLSAGFAMTSIFCLFNFVFQLQLACFVRGEYRAFQSAVIRG